MTKRLFIHSPAILFQARINSATLGQVVTSIPFDTMTPGSSFAIGGKTLLVGTAAGRDDLGRVRVRSASSDTLYINRASKGTRDGEVVADDNAYLTVIDQYAVWAKIPYIGPLGEIYKDAELPVGNNMKDLSPVAVMGPSVAGTIAAATGLLTVAFDGTGSFQFPEATPYATGGITSFLWDVGGGTITVGAYNSSTITATFPAGVHWVRLTAIATSGQSHSTRRMVFARDPVNDLSTTEFQITNHVIRPDGQEISLRILRDIPRSTYPDGSAVLIWEDEPASPADRSHMLFIGWMHNEENSLTAERTDTLKDTTLHCLDMVGKLKTLPGFPQRVSAAVTPATWSEMKNPTILKYICYLLQWHSTALELADFDPFGGSYSLNGYKFITLGSEADTLFGQVEALARNVTPDHVFGCTRRGQLTLSEDPMIEGAFTRTSVVQTTLTDADWQSIRWPYQRAPRVYHLRAGAIISREDYLQVVVNGVTVNRIEIAKCIAPASVPGQGAMDMESNERIATSQFMLNVCTGHRYARLNARYGPFVIVVPWARIKNLVEPAYMEWVELTMNQGSWRENPTNEPSNALGYGLIKEIAVRYEYAATGTTETATIMWEAETSGEPAQDVAVVYE